MEKSRFARSVAVLVAVASIGLGAAVSHAQWSQSQRAGALSDCLASCEKAASPQSRHLCPRYCDCSLKESEARFSDFKAVDDAARTGNPQVVESLKQIAQMCASQVTRQ